MKPELHGKTTADTSHWQTYHIKLYFSPRVLMDTDCIWRHISNRRHPYWNILFSCPSLSEFIQKLIKKKAKQDTEAKVFNLNFKYTHEVLSINKPNFVNWTRLLYPKVLVIKETIETAYSVSLLDIYYHLTLLLENEIRISKFKVICPPRVSNTMQPNVHRRLLFLCQRWKEETCDWQVNIFESPPGELLIPCFSMQWSHKIAQLH